MRTPLAVGLLWFFSAWILFADQLLDQLPAESSVQANLLDLSEFFGTGATVAAISFAAFLFGSVVTFDPDSFPIRFAGNWIALRKRYDVSLELMDFLEQELSKYGAERNNSGARFDQLAPTDELRARLLVASQEMYGEYDRLEAEATFRVNVALPLLAFAAALYATSPDSIWPSKVAAIALIGMAIVLFVQGVRKHRLSTTVLMRAVLAGVIEHPSVVRARLMSDEGATAHQQEQWDAAEAERLRKHVQRVLQELSTAHTMKADADEKDDAASARQWRNQIKNLENQLTTIFDTN